MMDPPKPGSRPRPQVAPKPRLRTASDDALAHRWDPQPNVSPLITLNSRSTSPPPSGGKRSPDPFAVEHVKLYPSYVVETGSSDSPYEAHVQGWLYTPGVNRKGRLMTAAVERLIGNPGKYTSIAEAAAQTQAEEPLVEIEEPSSSWLSLRPSMFRTRSSKGSAPNSQPASASGSRSNSRTPSRAASPEPMDFTRHSSPNLSQSSELQSPGSPQSTGSIEDGSSLSIDTPPKRPEMRRTATYTFDARSNPKGKAASPSAQTRREQKHIVRERLIAITHKSLTMRNVQISILSEPDSKGHRKRRVFWCETDDSGRFTHMCPVPFRPDRVRANSGAAVAFSECFFVPRSGVSVISDIDDTVRYTGVTKSKKELLQNVLVKSFDDCAIDGVRDWFQHMAEFGATFHYVSNSPWQLYDVIHGYLRHHQFPEGSVHLKKYAGVFDGLTEPAKGRKRATLEKIMLDFPLRRFILIGDSGEADLEAYSELARKFPSQVIAIYIRDITTPVDEPLYDPRMSSAHRRHHSADLIAMDTPPDMPPRPEAAPALPPRRREAPDLLSSKRLTQNPPEHDNDPIDAIVNSVETSEPAVNDETSSEHTLMPEAKDGNDTPVPAITMTHVKNEPPKLPPRPKLLRRTSSKIFDGVNAASHAVGSAVRFLGPHQSHQQQNGAHGPSSTQSQVPPKPKLKPSRLASLSIGDDTPERQSRTHRKNPSASSGYSSSYSASSPTSRNTSPNASRIQSEATDSGVFINSSQDFVDIDRVDKRVEHWKLRLAKQHRLLPRHVELKTWREPSDVENQSLRFIKGSNESLI